MKLDMAKAYNRVTWPYLCCKMRKLGFAEEQISNLYAYIWKFVLLDSK